jgi:non-heme chloroperoxidase
MADNNARPNTNRRRDLDGLHDAYISAVNSALETRAGGPRVRAGGEVPGRAPCPRRRGTDIERGLITVAGRRHVLVGHSTGGGEVTRYIGRHGTSRVAKVLLVGAIPPLMLKTDANPEGLPIEAFDAIRDSVSKDRSEFYRELSAPFYGANRPGSTVSQGLRDQFWLQSMQVGIKAAYDCVKAFSETDLTMDLQAIDVPTLIIHGDDDQIVPIGASAMKSSKIVKGAQLKVYPGAPHGLTSTLKGPFNTDLLAFLKS